MCLINNRTTEQPLRSFGLATCIARQAARLALAMGLAAAAFTLPLTAASAASHDEPTAAVKLDKDGTVWIAWTGEVVPGMADYLHRVFLKYGLVSNRVVVTLDSPGGAVDEGERVIKALQEIKQTHRLITVVLNGSTCASMCVPIYLQGEERFAAPVSIWLFHEAAEAGKNGTVRTDPKETLRLFKQYFVPAGVSLEWLNSILPSIRQANLWMTGEDLITHHTGIITDPLDSRTVRAEVIPQPTSTSDRPHLDRQ